MPVNVTCDSIKTKSRGPETLKHRRRRQEPRYPAVRVLGVGATGGTLVESLARLSIGTGGAFEHAALPIVEAAATGRNHTVPRINAVLRNTTGMNLVVILASLAEPGALRKSSDVVRGARAEGALVFAILVEPPLQSDEGASEVVAEIADCADALIFVPAEPSTSVLQHLLDAYIAAAFMGPSEGFRPHTPVGADLLDVRKTFIGTGEASTGAGLAIGADRALLAAERAIIDVGSTRLATAKGILILVAGGGSLRLREVATAAYAVQDTASHDTTVTLGAHYDERLGETVRVTLVVAQHALAQMAVSDPRGSCFPR